MSFKFAHIAPYSAMEIAHSLSGCNMVLAHIVDENEKYAKYYASSNKPTIMDNGAFELGQPYNIDKLIELGHKVKANYIVAPDYPGQDWKITRDAFERFREAAKKEGFGLMYVPQSVKGDISGYVESWKWAAGNKDIDLIGCSILGAPTADPSQDRMIIRYKFLRLLEPLIPRKKVHMLGMLDSVYEVALCKQFEHLIYSWDSSQAVWYGMNGLDVRSTTRKFEQAVDFNHPLLNKDLIRQNIFTIQGLL